jgi:predicted RNA binding protein with dsRBD fold (UPF0201 family)
VNDPVLKQIRESRGRLRQIERAQRAEFAARRRLYQQARAKGIQLRLIAQAAGVSEGAVSLALRPDRGVALKHDLKESDA